MFPEARHDAVIQVGSAVQRHGDKEPFIRCVLVLGGCAAVPGCAIVSCRSEEQLLQVGIGGGFLCPGLLTSGSPPPGVFGGGQ